MTSPDPDLRARFAALRRADAATAPDLDALFAKGRARPRGRLVLPAMLAAAAVVIAVAGVRYGGSRPSIDVVVAPSAPSLVAWRSPTASLLQTPGRELLQTVPTLTSSLWLDVP
jgi:hypothetical protein